MSTRPPRPVRKAARKALQVGCEDLGLMGKYFGNPTVGIEWCSREEIGGNTGETRGMESNKIWVASDMDAEQTVRTIFHELRHVQHYRRGVLSKVRGVKAEYSVEKAERIANGFEHRMWRRFRHEFENEPWFVSDDEAL